MVIIAQHSCEHEAAYKGECQTDAAAVLSEVWVTWMLLYGLRYESPTYWRAWATLSEEELPWATCKIYNIVNVYK